MSIPYDIIKNKLKVETIVRITKPDGSVIEVSGESDPMIPTSEDFDLETREGFLRNFDSLEKGIITARKKAVGETEKSSVKILGIQSSVLFLRQGFQYAENTETYFSFCPSVHMLDWYHLEKRMTELLSMVLKGKKTTGMKSAISLTEYCRPVMLMMP